MSREYPERPHRRRRRGGLARRAGAADPPRGKPPRLGQWSLPGGALRLGETLAEGIAREVLEETGLALDRPELLTTVDLIERDEAGSVRFHYTLVDFTAEAPDGRGDPR